MEVGYRVSDMSNTDNHTADCPRYIREIADEVLADVIETAPIQYDNYGAASVERKSAYWAIRETSAAAFRWLSIGTVTHLTSAAGNPCPRRAFSKA